jgi:hypothetical protein
MPAWAYYYQQIFNDKTLNIDPSARFVSPSGMQSDILFDYNQFEPADSTLPIEGDEGANNPAKTIEIPISDGKEKVLTESQIFNADDAQNTGGQKNDKVIKQAPIHTQPKDTIKKRRGIINRIFKKSKDTN